MSKIQYTKKKQKPNINKFIYLIKKKIIKKISFNNKKSLLIFLKLIYLIFFFDKFFIIRIDNSNSQ
jgi:hypothetical protein